MKTETIHRDDHQVQIIAEVDEEMLERFKRSAARKISTQAKITGFRPGKAPYEVVRRMFGDKAIQEEAITMMLDEVYPAAIADAKIDPAGPGRLEEILQVEPPKFSFIVPLAAKVELGEYRAIRAEHNPPVIEEQKVEEVLRRLQRRSAISKPVERPAQAGDLVVLTLSANLVNPDEDADPVLIPESRQQLVAGDPRDTTDPDGNEWPFPGFSAALVGVSAEDEKALSYTFPDDGSNDDLNGKEAVFKFKVEAVQDLELHPLDDEFAQSVGNYETIDKLRETIKTDLQNDATRRYNQGYIEGVIDTMIQSATVKYAPTELEHEIEHSLEHLEERLAREQLDLATYLKTRNLTREDFIAQEVRPSAERALVRRLVLDEFAQRENLQIGPEEASMIYNMAQNQARQDPSLKSLAKGKTTKKEVGESLARQTLYEIFNQRMINRLRDIATGKADQPEEAAEAAPIVETTEAEPPVDENQNENSGETPQAAE